MQTTMQFISQHPLTMPRRSILAMLPALLSACSALDVLNATVATDTYRASLGLPYGSDPRQKLDVYQPSPTPSPAASKAPMVVFFYGGSWSSGNRADYRFVGEALASQGIVAVVADYRLSPAARYPAFVRDSAAAVRWAFDHAGHRRQRYLRAVARGDEQVGQCFQPDLVLGRDFEHHAVLVRLGEDS